MIREGKGAKDRVVMLPRPLVEDLKEQMGRSRALWAAGSCLGRARRRDAGGTCTQVPARG